ncbi:MAG: isoprenylcysteine carboxylmethyltransferase family protein [Acidobacteriaceae bacterium]|nr:isoprenylcysteine carboxylmethyltransferase family protein [Acidobacteriaceae bacterium]
MPEVIGLRTKRSGAPSKASDRGSCALILILLPVGMALDLFLSLNLPQAAITRMRVELFFLGICLMLAGIALRRYAMAVLGRYFTAEVGVQAGQTVIDTGPYRYVQHPAYSGALLSGLGFGFALGNWAGLIAMLACAGTAYAYRVPIEESALIASLGEPYKQYMRRTWRLMPFIF